MEVFAYVFETTYELYLQVQEDLLLRIVEIVEASAEVLLFRHVLCISARDGSGRSEAKASRGGSASVAEQGELPFPDFAPQQIAEMNNKLEYPAPESTLFKKK